MTLGNSDNNQFYLPTGIELMARENDLQGILPTLMIIPPGATLAVLITPIACECSSGLKYLSGGSLEIQFAPNPVAGGATALSATQLVDVQGKGYLMGSSEAINFDGPVRYYLMATGATVLVNSIRGLTSGY